jgi:hypothetical protein
MENTFADFMSKKSTKELLEILKIKDQYQPEAVVVVENELRTRGEIQESSQVNLEDGDDFEFFKKVKSLNDSQLQEMFKVDYQNHTLIEIQILNQELAIRGIETKCWYYVKGENRFGPYTTTEFKEFAKQGKIDYYDYIWRDGLEEWIEANHVIGLFNTELIPPRTSSIKPSWIQSKKQKTVGITIAAILMFITSIIWLLIGITQTTASDSTTSLTGLWNIGVAISFIVVGAGCLMLKRWGYRLGIGDASINAILFGYYFLAQNASIFNLFMIAIQTATIILLYVNKKQFDSQDIVEIGI